MIKNLYSAKPNSYIPWSIFRDNQSLFIDKLFTISTTLVACQADAPDVVYGYVMYSKLNDTLLIHFIYVKQDFRHNGVMKELLHSIDPDYKNKMIIATQVSKTLSSFHDNFNIAYDPYTVPLLLAKVSNV